MLFWCTTALAWHGENILHAITNFYNNSVKMEWGHVYLNSTKPMELKHPAISIERTWMYIIDSNCSIHGFWIYVYLKVKHQIATDHLETMKSQRSDLSGDDVVKVLMDSFCQYISSICTGRGAGSTLTRSKCSLNSQHSWVSRYMLLITGKL